MNTSDPRKAYRQSAIHSENAADIFIQLYEQLSSLLYSAASAVEAQDIQKKTEELNRAFTILLNLQGALDFERGGEVALSLHHFYRLVRREISEGSVKLDAEKLRKAAGHVLEMRNLWEQAQAITDQHAAASPSSPVSTGRPLTDAAESASRDAIPESRTWNA